MLRLLALMLLGWLTILSPIVEANSPSSGTQSYIRLPFALGSSCGIYSGHLNVGAKLVVPAVAGQILQIQQRENFWYWKVWLPQGNVLLQSEGWTRKLPNDTLTHNFEIPTNGDIEVEVISNQTGISRGPAWMAVCIEDWEG